jgi:hypothetical protein
MPNVGTPNFIKQTLLDLKAQIELNTMIMGDFNTPLSPLPKKKKRKKKKSKKPQN